jgi:hypothetical protein
MAGDGTQYTLFFQRLKALVGPSHLMTWGS